MYRLSFALTAFLLLGEKSRFQEAKLLDVGAFESPASRRYYCVEIFHPDRILIGYAEAGKKSGDAPKAKGLPGTPVAVQFDDQDLWIRRPHGRPLRLHQDYLTRAFPKDSPCGQVVENAVNRLNSPQKSLKVR